MVVGNGVSRLPVRGTGPKGQCESCRAAQWEADRRLRDTADPAGSTDSDVLVTSGPEFAGMVVFPRSHVGGLEELPIPQRAKVLAAVRRATRSVGQENPWSTPRIVVRTDLPASEGHMCFHVLPSVPESASASGSRSGRARICTSHFPESQGRPDDPGEADSHRGMDNKWTTTPGSAAEIINGQTTTLGPYMEAERIKNKT